MLEFRILGQFSVLHDGRTVEISSRTAQSLLVYLLLHPNLTFTREELARELWPELDETSAQRDLQPALRLLRKALKKDGRAFLKGGQDTVGLEPGQEYWFDAAVLVREPSPDSLLDDLNESAAAYWGELLPGFFDGWIRSERERLRGIFEQKISQLLDGLVNSRRWLDVIERAGQWIELGSAPERVYSALMLAQYNSNDLEGVKFTFQRCVDNLARDFGMEPSGKTRAYFESLVRSDPLGFSGLELSIPSTGAAAVEARLPYKGLPGYEESDADLFTGREAVVAGLVSRLCQPGIAGHLILLVGESGSGKSSLLRAGLVPAVKYARPQVGDCQTEDSVAHAGVILMTPTGQPLEALAASLAHEFQGQSAVSLAADLARSPHSLYQFLQNQPRPSFNLLLVVDDLEELFTLCQDEQQRAAFLENLLHAAESGGVRVVLALRAEDYSVWVRFPHLRTWLSECQFHLEPVTAPEVQRIIEVPARLDGLELEPGLVDQILADAGMQADRPELLLDAGLLPYLSQALFETWIRREDRRLTLSAYQQSGGVRFAIARSAEQALHALTPEQQEIARSIFLRLFDLEAGFDVGTFIPRKIEMVELLGPEPDWSLQTVFNLLVKARLIKTSGSLAELGHAVLVQAWPTLRDWLAAEYENLRLRRDLAASAYAWQVKGHPLYLFYRGARLAQALELAVAHPDQVSPQEKEFIWNSKFVTDRETVEREAQRERDLETARRLAQTQVRLAQEGRKWNRILAGAASVLLGVLLLLGFLARSMAVQRNQAEIQSRLFRSRELAASAISSLPVDPQRSILLALQAVQVQNSSEAEEALHQAVQSSRVEKSFQLGKPFATNGAFTGRDVFATSSMSPDSGWVTELWDINTGNRSMVLNGQILGKAWPNRRNMPFLLAGKGDSATVAWLNMRSGEPLALTKLTVERNSFDKAEISPDRKWIALNLNSGKTEVYNLSTGHVMLSLGQDGSAPGNGAAFSPDGSLLVTTVNHVTGIWNIYTGKQQAVLPSASVAAVAPVFSQYGSRIAYGLGSLVKVVETQTGKEVFSLAGHAGQVDAVAFSRDSTLIAAGASDGTATLWDANTGQLLMTLAGHTGAVTGVAFSPFGMLLATTGADGTARVWDISPAGGREGFSWYDDFHKPFYSLSFSPDGKKLAAGGGDQAGEVVDTVSGEKLFTLPGVSQSQGNIAFSPDGNLMAVSSSENDIRLMDASTGKPLKTLEGHTGWVSGLDFSPDGSRLVSIGLDRTIKMWNPVSGKLLWSSPLNFYTLSSDPAAPLKIVFSPNGTQFAISKGSRAEVWNASTGREVLDLPVQDAQVFSLAISPDGNSLAAGLGPGQGIRVWDSYNGKKLASIQGLPGTVLALSFNHDGSQLYSGSDDGALQAWDLPGGRLALTLAHQNASVTALTLSPDGSQLASAGEDGTVYLYALKINDLIALAKNRLTRGLTLEECQKYLHVNACPTAGK